MGLRFSEDRAAQGARFRTVKARLGDAFEIIELDSSPGNPALGARARVVEFLHERLG